MAHVVQQAGFIELRQPGRFPLTPPASEIQQVIAVRVQLEVPVKLRGLFAKILPMGLPLPVDSHDSQGNHFCHVFHFPPSPSDL